ncbi:MAG: hypothetical protein R2706_02880 [Acidimicrobiales bacterium]
MALHAIQLGGEAADVGADIGRWDCGFSSAPSTLRMSAEKCFFLVQLRPKSVGIRR